MDLDPFKKYIYLIAAALVLGAFAATGYLGYRQGRMVQGAQDAKGLQASATALRDAGMQLKAAGSAIEAINEEAARRIVEANKQAADSKTAAAIARKLARAADARAKKWAAQVEAAKKKSPACEALLHTDLGAVCGLD